jgi:DNA polymerase-3 subunit alpha
MFLIFDTETTGLPRDYNAPLTDFDNWPRVVQIAWQLHDATGKLISNQNMIVKPEGFTIPFNAEKVHGISTERAMREGMDLREVLGIFLRDVEQATYLGGHNIEFDNNVMGCELLRMGMHNAIAEKQSLDTKDLSTDFCAIPGGKGGRFKWPTLTELYHKLFNETFGDAHDAAYDVSATGKAFFELLKLGVIKVPEAAAEAIVYEAPVLKSSNFQHNENLVTEDNTTSTTSDIDVSTLLFAHLHVHTQFSVLQSTSEISTLIKKAKEWEMPAIAMTDHGNMMAAFQFVSTALKQDVKPIVGCEMNICRDMHDKKVQDNGFQIPVLAKNKKGYHNLAKLSSLAHTEGFYYVPRIDKTHLLQFKEDLIVLSGGLFGEVAWKILNEGDEKAEEAFLWYKENFGDDFYAELNRHGLEEEDHVNKVVLRFCEKHGVKYVATNSSYYTTKEEAEAQDALICVREGEYVSKPKKYIGKRGRDFRYGLPNDEYFLKTPDQMRELFRDLPLAISNTAEIAEKCESYKLAREVLLPKFDIPEQFMDAEDEVDGGKRGENNFLRHLTYVGAEKRYGTITDDIRDRLDFELATIANTGYPGYFLIVQDFCNKAREMGVSVGPGRGSAAGSAVAYCIGITNVDPIKYSLLFERFLNPERVSMPDIDIDFDDEGREKVINYVREKYGKDMVAQIITYGTMGGKSAIRDAGRVFELPLSDTDRIAKLMPDSQDLSNVLKWDDKTLNDKLNTDSVQLAKQLRTIASENTQESKVLKMAGLLEGSVRNTGIHACGVIITPDVITNYVPVATAKDSDMWCTQFDNSVVESAGLLKMDFLGLKTLTLIKHSLRNIKERHGIDIDIEAIPIDDEKTYELFQRGHTVGIFQYESDGMQKYMKELKPTVFDDLIAMNALYRPGPLEYIPSFVRRKNGQEEISYDLPEMEEYLKDTYGITVYQEQVMLLSQKLAGFTKGEADVLRKAMGKKQKDVLDKMKGKFVEGAKANNHPEDKLEKIWTDWEAFASYAFNKSHSTCYAWIAYQTAYLKAHYPAEYMAAVLSNNMNDIKQVSFFMQECKKQSVNVLGPDVNESKSLFSVNDKGEIRFGLAAVKGVGESAVESIIAEQKNGRFTSIYDFLARVDSKASNKKTLENLALAGALDEFGINREAYFVGDGKSETFIETLVKYAAAVRDSKNTSQVSLFGGEEESVIAEPAPPKVEGWDTMTQLTKEKEVVGMFISGHPLDDFAFDIESFCSGGGLKQLREMETVSGRELKLAGTVIDFQHRVSKTSGKPFGSVKLEDYEESHEFMLFGEEYLKFKHLFNPGEKLFITGRVQPRRFGGVPGSLEFKISNIELLAEIRDKRARFIDIFINIDTLSDKLIQDLIDTIPNGEGKSTLRINIETNDAGTLKLPSTTFNKVAVTTDVLRKLEEFPIEIKIKES